MASLQLGQPSEVVALLVTGPKPDSVLSSLPFAFLTLMVTVCGGLPLTLSVTLTLKTAFLPLLTVTAWPDVVGRTASMRTVHVFVSSTLPAASVER